MLKAFKYRIYPSNLQKIALAQSFGASRFLYNKALDFKITQYKDHKKSISCYDLTTGLLKDLKNQHDWLKTPPSQSLQMTLRHLDSAYSNFFRRIKKGENPGFPKFKSKHARQSFALPQGVSVDFKNSKVKLPKIGEIFCVLHRKFSGKIKTCTVSKTLTNKYFISILVDDGQELPVKSFGKEIGIDLGIKTLITCSDHTVIDSEKFLNKNLKQLKNLQRNLSLKKKGSKNRMKTKLLLAKVHEKISNKRKDYLHKVSKKIINENQVIFLEDLNINKMLEKSHGNLSRQISDMSWRALIDMLKYKGDLYGKYVFEVNPKNTSKMCSTCRNIKEELKLSEREWQCKHCHSHHDRDFNASMNVLKLGQELPEYKALKASA